MSETKTDPKPAAKAKKVKFSRGLFSINAKFSFFIGGTLAVLMILVTLIIRNQLQADLSREVSERGATIARNLTAPVLEAMIIKDDLTLNILVKGVVEEELQAPVVLSWWAQAFKDLVPGEAKVAAKNEGVTRAIVVDQRAEAKDQVIADSKKSAGEGGAVYQTPELVQYDGEPFPVYSDGTGRLFYDISSGIRPGGGEEGQIGTIHLAMRRDVITDAVRVATTRLVAIMLVALVIGVILLTIVVRLLMRPIKHLVGGVTAVAHGDFSKQIRINPADELGELVDAYNGMAKSLQEKEAVQEALAKYTSKELVSQMLSDKANLELGGQRVNATIFFSVMRGLAALAGTMEPEKFVGIMNEYLEIETDIIMKNGGSIDKFIGDEVMALWGLSGGDRVDNAVRAVKAAVEIQEAIAANNARREAEGKPFFECSIGLNSGDVVSGNMGSSVKMDNTVLGGSVNLAARLGLVAAKGGQTLTSHETYTMVADRFKIDKLAPMPLKGIKEPVPLYWPRKVA